jgi:F-type H+-transporting ATPase subunit gamma
MARVQEIAAQIASLKELSGVIAAIRVMATAQMQQGQRALDAVRNYTEIIRRAFVEAAVLVPDDGEAAPAQLPPRPGLVVFCSEHGFCGAFNEALIRAAAESVKQEANLRLLFVGSRGAQRAAEHGLRPHLMLTMATHSGGVGAAARRVGAALYPMFVAQTITSAEVLYMREISGQAPSLQRLTLLPFEASPVGAHQTTAPPLFNLQPRQLRDDIAAEYVFAMLEAAAMESFTSENAARFRTMQAAHENIERKSAELDRLARRLRQEAVTAEILELIGGAEALKQE